jgi:hypothetical protein
MMQFITTAHDTNHQAFSINHFQQTDWTELFFCWSETRKVKSDHKAIKIPHLAKYDAVIKITHKSCPTTAMQATHSLPQH